MEAIDAHKVITNVLSTMQSDIESKQLTVTTSLNAKMSHIWADAVRLQQVFINLLSNAVKFTPTGGQITVRSATTLSGDIQIAVEDTGIGIDPAIQMRLFEPFEQGPDGRRHGGLGLGLSIVKSIVALHGGSVSVESLGSGKGSIFSVTLHTVPQVNLQSAHEETDIRTGDGYRVLVVEDHEDTRAMVSQLVRSIGCSVTEAGSVAEALTCAESQSFDILLSDVGLPDGTGTELMRSLKSTGIRGIAMSGYGQEEDLNRSLTAGFVTHIVKPFDLEHIVAAIDGVMSPK